MPNPHFYCVTMALDGSSVPVNFRTNEIDNESCSTLQTEASVVIEQGGIHEFVTTFLIKRGIRDASRQILEGGRSKISAPTTREKLLAALAGLPYIRLAEAK